MIFQKGKKASESDFYNDVVKKQLPREGGSYVTMAENGLVCFVAVPRINKLEKQTFEYRTKKMGYITDEEGMICLIADNILCTELCFYPYPAYKEMIENLNNSHLSVVLIDTISDKIVGVKELFIPEAIQNKLKEQWLLCIENRRTFAEHLKWMQTNLYQKTQQDNLMRCKELQAVEEAKAEIIILILDEGGNTL